MLCRRAAAPRRVFSPSRLQTQSRFSTNSLQSSASSSTAACCAVRIQRRVEIPACLSSSSSSSSSSSAPQNQTFAVPLTVADLHLRHEQLPFAYFFRETLDAQELQRSLTNVLQEEFAVAGGRLSSCHRNIECAPQDTIPLCFAETECSLAEWNAAEGNQGHRHQSGKGEHPVLLPLFDSLFDDEGKDNLLSVRVTYFGCGVTCIGVNINHCLADTASCVHFVKSWGREMRKKSRSTLVCFDRAYANVSGMSTVETVELAGIGLTRDLKQKSFLPAWMTEWFQDAGMIQETLMTKELELIDHQYLALHFSVPILTAMKAHGMILTEGDEFVSTNDMVTAAGWLLKRSLSQQNSWNISVAVNLRGRCGVSAFNNNSTPRSGLFGNAIANVVAEMEPTSLLVIRKRDVRTAAHSIRQALRRALLKIPDRIARSRMGKWNAQTSSADSFSTTSWGQLSPWNIRFAEAAASVSAFHGQPAHPLPAGRTFSSVIHCNNVEDGGGCTYELFLPSDQADAARRLHAQLCASYMDWNEKTTNTLRIQRTT